MSYPTYSVSALWAMVHPTLHSPFRRSAVMDEQRVIVMNREPTCDGTTHVHEVPKSEVGKERHNAMHVTKGVNGERQMRCTSGRHKAQ
eukprot:scaffold292440_cov26-Tisochrysis_lutea.AAC.1